MPFEKIDINSLIQAEKENDPDFAVMWDETEEEYRLIGEMIALRKSLHISQSELAEKCGKKQQMISRMEQHAVSPSLRNFTNVLDHLGYQLKIVEKSSN